MIYTLAEEIRGLQKSYLDKHRASKLYLNIVVILTTAPYEDKVQKVTPLELDYYLSTVEINNC